METTRRIAVVTGGSRGIGRACALSLARDGFTVVLTYVSKPELAAEVVREIENTGGAARAVKLDAADREAAADFFKSLKDEPLHVLVNNAGITKDGLLIRMKDEDFDRVLDVNLKGAFTTLREAAKLMSKRRGGRIINIASIVGQMGNPGQANYVAAKAGLIGLTKTAARELGSRAVTVNAVAPGFIETDMTKDLPEDIKQAMRASVPLGRFGSAEDVAAAVSYLASDAAGYVTGQVLAVNGGMYM
ncbi:3-oxoacyl-(acyl-carrier-protein) reductase [Alkalidesulfovibrio alkalitolerans DSM 16529]|uniref:3-oxoacyl-[acyl-carrier-protein] reductase n=1 Tax=Alkalidesulfovibrio alkalitolerans DSM 16529 TaxID=1121439 RepID=S7UL18_9BACT|nr:3-oxoacyl-[acyl-carrier-protein] reductase [Alkalidesulfovibrio alkalitolerans]EPR33023.1 3-oxoacyl-(acyl-carrier-protein) reductase [Alkalidesulfovibrio alkalitolerans DSM 16529]